MKWLLLALLISSTSSFGQEHEPVAQEVSLSYEGGKMPTENPTENPTSQVTKTDNAPVEPPVAYEPDISAPAGLNLPVLEGFKALFFRVHTLSVDAHVKEMKRDGVTEREFVAGFTSEGAIAYDHEMWGHGLTPDEVKTSRNGGFQILAYKISLHTDKSIKISSSLINWKNMNSVHLDKDVKYGCTYDCMFTPGFFRVVDNINIFNFEYDKDVARQIKTTRISAINIDLKVSLLKSEDGSFHMAIKAGGTPIGLHWAQYGSTDSSTPDVTATSGLYHEVRYGVEFMYNSRTGWRVHAGMNGKNRWDDAWDSTSEDINADRHQMVLNPFVNVSKRVSKPGKIPVRVGAQVEGNILMKDLVYGEVNRDLKSQNGNGTMINGSIYVNF